MVNYGTGKVYKITSDQTDQIYIGSTCSPLSQRMANHRNNMRAHAAGKTNYTTSFAIVQYDDAVITLIEDCPCENKERLHRRERFHIENTPNYVNRCIPGRTHAEYYDDYRVELVAKRAKYYEVNRVEIAVKSAEWRELNRDDLNVRAAEYRESNRAEINARSKAYSAANREKISERESRRIDCECGAVIAAGNMAVHRRTAKHMRIVAANQPPAVDLVV